MSISPDYEAASSELDAALAAVQADPEANLERLAAALAELGEFADALRDDTDALAARTRARLALTQLYLASDQAELAAATMDTLLLESWFAALPVDEFGPSVVALHDERRAALREPGEARIAAYCSVPCQLFIDEARSPNPSPDLLLGAHRVALTDLDGQTLRSELVELSEPFTTFEVRYTAPPASDAEPRRPAIPPLTLAGAAVLTAGVATMAFGAYEYTLDTTARPSASLDSTWLVYDHRRVGGWLIGSGLALATAGALLVVFGELRQERPEKRPTLALALDRDAFGLVLGGRF